MTAWLPDLLRHLTDVGYGVDFATGLMIGYTVLLTVGIFAVVYLDIAGLIGSEKAAP